MIAIYYITSLIDGRIYVGQTCEPVKRKSRHFCDLQKGIHKNPRLQSIYNKHGRDSLVFEIQFWVEEKIANETEIAEIARLNTTNKKFGLNLLKGQWPIARGKDHHMYGKTHTDEVKEKLSQSSKRSYEERFGIERAKEEKQRRSEISLGENNNNFKKFDIDLALSLRKEGKLLAEIASIFNVTRQTLAKRFKDYEILQKQ